MLCVVDALTGIEYHLIVGLLKLPMEPRHPGRRPNVNALVRAPDRVSCTNQRYIRNVLPSLHTWHAAWPLQLC